MLYFILILGFLVLLSSLSNNSSKENQLETDEYGWTEADIEWMEEGHLREESLRKEKQKEAALKAYSAKIAAKKNARKAYLTKISRKGFWNYARGK